MVTACRNYGQNLKLQSLHFLTRAGLAQGGVFYAVDNDCESSDYVLWGIDSQVHDDYLRHYGDIDPLHARHHSAGGYNIVTEESLPSGLRHRWDIYANEFLRPGGLCHIMEVFLRNDSRIFAGLSLIRAVAARPFSSAEMDVIEQARRYVECNLRGFLQLDAQLNADPLGVLKQSLSRQESRILDLLCEGASNKEISRRLFIEDCTTKTHLRHIYAKFSVGNRQELLALLLNHCYG